MKLEQKNKSSHSVAEALSWDAEEKEYNLYSINKYNLLYIRPGLTEEHALVYLTDGTVLKTYNPYPYIKGRFNEFPLYYN